MNQKWFQVTEVILLLVLLVTVAFMGFRMIAMQKTVKAVDKSVSDLETSLSDYKKENENAQNQLINDVGEAIQKLREQIG